MLTDAEICDQIQENSTTEELENEAKIMVLPEKISSKAALEMVQKLRWYFLQKTDEVEVLGFLDKLEHTTEAGGKTVTSSKRRHKNSMKCAVAKFLNQDGRPDRYLKLKRMIENSAKKSPTQPQRTHRHRSIPEIAVLCHLPRKTSQLPAEPEEWPKR